VICSYSDKTFFFTTFVLENTFGVLEKSWNLFWARQWEPCFGFVIYAKARASKAISARLRPDIPKANIMVR